MNRLATVTVFAALLGLASSADAMVARVRIPGALGTNPVIGVPGVILPTSQIPSINVPNIVPTIGDLPLPILPTPSLPISNVESAAPSVRLLAPEAAPAAPAAVRYNGFATAHAVAVPLVDAQARTRTRRDTVENRLRTRRLVEFVRDTLELDDETTLEDLESAFDGRADEEEDRTGTVVLPERELEEELGLR